MGKKKRNNGKKGGNRFFRWIRSDLPDEEDKKTPVLLLGVSKITDSPFVRRRSVETSGSYKFFRPATSKYTRGLQGDERLEKIRKDLLVHKSANISDDYVHNDKELSIEPDDRCLKLNCVGNCICDRKKNSNRGSFSFHRPDQLEENLSENEIEFKYTEHQTDAQPSSSKQSYNITPKSTERKHFLLSNLNERFRKTLSLDSRKLDTNRTLSVAPQNRPKSLVGTSNICIQPNQPLKPSDPFVQPNFSKASQPKKKRKSFFSLDTFFDKKSDTSSIDDYVSSKYKRFELESDDSPLFKSENRERTPDLLNLPVIIDSVRKKQSETRRQLEKIEKYYYKNLSNNKTVIDAVPKDATDIQGPSGHANPSYDDDDVEYIEPIRSNFTSQSTLILDKNNEKITSVLTINTEDTDIKLPSSTVSPKSITEDHITEDFDSIGPYEIEIKEADLLKSQKNLIVKVMDKSVDSIGSCSLDVDASTDFSDTTSGSLNLLTPSSTTSRIKDFTSKIQERAGSTLQPPSNATPIPSPNRTIDEATLVPKKSDNLLKPPVKIHIDSGSHRSRGNHKKRDDPPRKKPSYLNLACSVNGYTNLTTYDSKLRQDINKSREASPIRPITHTYQYKSENNSLLVPVPVSANKLLVPTFGHDTGTHLTPRAPSKAHTDPYLSTSPLHVYMAAENKQLKNDFLGPSMTSTRSYMSADSKSFAASMLHQKDEVDNSKDMTFKSSYSETNFRKSVSSNGKETRESRYSAESYTISSNGVSKRVEITKENGEQLTSPMKSFIQQRVERLYGPGALAQGFFNQKRHKLKSGSDENDPKVLQERSLNCPESFSSPKQSETPFLECTSPVESESNCSLPVLRHLRPEFRAQLPILSPKKTTKTQDTSPQKEDIPKNSKTEEVNGIPVIDLNGSECDESVKVKVNGNMNGTALESVEICDLVKDAHYFLDLEKKETERLLALSATAEKELENLQDEEVCEEVLGLLRAASGKARLLATQKMQQFEGLCYNNINERKDEPFPTTLQDLQGFWDMVCLQVNNVNALYAHIAELKANGWREITSPPPAPPSASSATPRPRARAAPAPAHKNEKARLAAEKREADRKAMLEHRRRVARSRQQATPQQQEMGIEGTQEIEIFVGKNTKPSVAPKGDCASDHSQPSSS